MRFHHFFLQLWMVAGIVMGSTGVIWAGEEHHHHPGQATTELTLNQGKPWATDAPLRQGMAGIARDLEAALPRIHADAYSMAEYTVLANRLHGHVEFMVKNCKLPPDVDAQAHGVLEQILAGVNVMEGKSGQAQGAVLVLQALERYARHFDHPGWQPVNH
ncbi:MAG: hypothetical protein G8345_20490 [Magnetococcales bacterium]|nr:hypothetical protein [Magnetococcales bacterium]